MHKFHWFHVEFAEHKVPRQWLVGEQTHVAEEMLIELVIDEPVESDIYSWSLRLTLRKSPTVLNESMHIPQINKEKPKDHNMQPIGLGSSGILTDRVQKIFQTLVSCAYWDQRHENDNKFPFLNSFFLFCLLFFFFSFTRQKVRKPMPIASRIKERRAHLVRKQSSSNVSHRHVRSKK